LPLLFSLFLLFLFQSLSFILSYTYISFSSLIFYTHIFLFTFPSLNIFIWILKQNHARDETKLWK
jgi:hypothetical protein